MGSENFTQPATDVPVRHGFSGWLNTCTITNLGAAANHVDILFDSGELFPLYGGEQMVILAEDTSVSGTGGKICTSGYYINGDALATQLIRVVWTCKNPRVGLEDVTV